MNAHSRLIPIASPCITYEPSARCNERPRNDIPPPTAADEKIKEGLTPAAVHAFANPFAGWNRNMSAKITPPIDPKDPTIADCTPLLKALQCGTSEKFDPFALNPTTPMSLERRQRSKERRDEKRNKHNEGHLNPERRNDAACIRSILPLHRTQSDSTREEAGGEKDVRDPSTTKILLG